MCVESPEYCAFSTCVPTANEEVEHATVPLERVPEHTADELFDVSTTDTVPVGVE